MSDTVREQIAEIINDGTGGRVDMEQASSMSVIILSIVREAVSAVNQDLSDLGNDMYDKGYKAGSRDTKKSVMEVLS